MLNILEKNKRKRKNCVINLTQRGLQGMGALADWRRRDGKAGRRERRENRGWLRMRCVRF